MIAFNLIDFKAACHHMSLRKKCAILKCKNLRYNGRRLCIRHSQEYDAEAKRTQFKVICFNCQQELI